MGGPVPLTAQLRALGVRAGDALMVHASMRAVGGRAEALILALIEALGPEGTLLMVLGGDDEEPFDAVHLEVDVEDMGVLPEVFRTWPGVSISDHPAARCAALGRLAEELTRDPPLHDYYGPDSFLERFVARGGRVLRLGADIDTVTLTHHAEYLAAIPDPIRVSRPYTLLDGSVVDIHSLDDTDGVAVWPHGDYFAQIMRDYLATDHVQKGPAGGCVAELLEGPHFVAFAVQWMEGELRSGPAE